MSEINFYNKGPAFENLVKKAEVMASDGKLSTDEKKSLREFALSDKTFTIHEKIFLEALNNQDNVEHLKNGVNPYDFVFELLPETEKVIQPKDYEFEKELGNPLEAKINDTGFDKFNKVMADENITSVTLTEEIFNLPRVKNNDYLCSDIQLLILNMLDDKEPLVYLKSLLTERVPPLSDQQAEKIISRLADMAKADFNAGVKNPRDLVVAALHDIAAPENISQRAIGTCAGTCVQIQLALKSPVQYLDMLEKFARNEGYNTVSGKTIKPNNTYELDGTKRTISSSIMQNAIMDFASGGRRTERLEYDFQQKKLVTKKEFDSTRKDGGLNAGEQIKALEAVFGKKLNSYTNADYTPAQLIKVLHNLKPSESNPLSISVTYSRTGRDAFHAINVIGINNREATVINPWGRKETIDLKTLEQNLYGVIGTPGAANNLNKFSGTEFSKIMDKAKGSWFKATDAISHTINNPAGRKGFLERMTMTQKAELLESLTSGSVTSEDKKAALQILSDIMQGQRGQDHQAVYPLQNALKKQGTDIVELLDDLKIKDKLFYDVASQAFNAFGDSPPDNKVKVAKLALDGSESSYNYFIKNATESDLLLLGKKLDGKDIAANPKSAAKIMAAMVKTYNEIKDNPPVKVTTKQEIDKFLKETNDNWNVEKEEKLKQMIISYNSNSSKTPAEPPVNLKDIEKFTLRVGKSSKGKQAMKLLLSELGYSKDTKNIDPKSLYTTFYYKDKEVPHLLGKIINS